MALQVLDGADGQPGLNDILRARAAQHRALVVETQERMSASADFVDNDDCLHPNGSGHARIAATFYNVLNEPVTRRRD